MAQPCIKNGVLLLMKRKKKRKFRTFGGPKPSGVNMGGSGAVTTDSLVGGLPFKVLNGKVSVATKVDGAPVVLEGAIVLDVRGFRGTVLPIHCASGVNVE